MQLLEQEKEEWEKELISHRETVTEEKVAEVVAMMSGVPIQRIAQAEGKRLMDMGKQLKGSVIGQDDAIVKIVKAIQRNRAGLKDPNKPIGSFMFLGPTGVGKCFTSDTKVKIKNKKTGKIELINISNLIYNLNRHQLD